MTIYRITAPNGKTYQIEGPPGASQEDVIRAVLAQAPEAGRAPPETTFLGQTKEAFKGLIPGAVGLVESAAIGASALLPEEQERAAREAIARVAGAAKAPFAPAPGYEESIPRKVTEAVGSTVPFLLAGPLGWAGRLGAVGLGVGAGAGEARTRAEAEGATAEQRGTATALGTIPGALEIFAPFRILSRIPEGEVLTAATKVKRVLQAAGEEAAQEAASGLAQNMIARGVYKPDQALIEGLGEQAAYGGATGAIVQGLMDLALGRRARGAGAGAPAEGQPGELLVERLRREQAQEIATRAEAKREPINRAQTVIDETLAQPITEAYPRLTQEIETLKQQPESKERNAAIRELEAERARRQREDTERARAGKKVAEGFLTAEEAAAQGVMPRGEFDSTEARREEIARLRAQREDMLVKGKPPAPKSPARRKFDELDARLVEIGGGRWTPTLPPPTATEPTTPTVEEPTVRGPAPLPDVLDSATIKGIGFTRGKIHDALVGKSVTDPEIRTVLEDAKERTTSAKTAAKIDAFVARLPEPVAPEAPAPVAPTAEAAPQAEPPVPAGFVRVYHSGSKGEGGFGRFVSTNRRYASDYRPDLPLFYTDVPENDPRVNSPDYPDTQGIKQGFTFNFELTPEEAVRLREIQRPEAAAPAPITETPSAPSLSTESKRIGAGVPVAGGPAAVSPAEGVGAAEPVRVVPPVEDAGRPVAGEGEQPAAVTEAPAPRGRTARAESAEATEPIVRGEYEPPVKEGLKPERERQLRAKLAQQRKEIAVLEAARDKAEGNVYLAEITGNEEGKIRAIDAHEGARLVLKKAVSSADRTYAQLFDLEKAEFEGSIGEAYVAELRAERDARDKAAREKTDTTKWPYTLNTAEAVREDVEYELPHSAPEYKAYIEKFFTPSRQLRKGVKEEDAVREGQELLSQRTLYRTVPQSPVVTDRISDAELNKIVSDIEKALGGKLGITVLDDVTDVDSKEAPGTRAGALIKGQIYLFRSGIAKGIEGQKTIFHEVFHKGLRNLTSPAEYRALMTKLYNQSAAVRQAADTYLASATGKKDTKDLSPQDAQVLAVEESLAEMAEQTNLTGSTLRQLGNFFARLADRFGMPDLARAIRTMGMDPLQSFIREAIQAGIRPSVGEGVTRFRAKVEKAEAEPERPGALVGERTEATAGDAIGRTLGERKTIGLRAQATDSLAGVEAEMGYLYGGNIRDNSGNMNPTVLLSRALDAPRFSAEALDYGTLKLGTGGMIDVTELELNGQRISYGNVLRDIKAEAERRGQTPEQFVNEIGETLAGRREYELMQDEDAREQEIEYFLSPEEAQAANDKFNNDAFIKDVSAKLDAIRFSFIDLMVSTGRITKDKADAWKEMSGYVPFKRIDELDKAYVSTSGQSGNRGMKLAAFKQMKQYKGSAERQTENPIKNFVGLIDWMTAESMKAESVGRALRDLELVGAAKYLPRGRDQMPDSQKGAVVSSWQKGQQKFYYVPDPANLAAFAGAKSMEIGRIMRAAQSFSQILRVGVTITPAFALKQIADDVTRAYVHSGVKNPLALTARILSNMPRNWWNEIKGVRSAGVAQLARMGVVPAYDTVQGGNVRNIFEETGISKRSTGRAILRILEAGAKASDVSVRQAIYDQTMKETGDTALAESRAREIINFSRRGAAATTDFLIRTIPFFNAYARSMDKLLLAAGGGKTVGVSTGYARNLFFKRMGVLTAMGLSYALLMSDDEEYQNLPDHVRDRNWVLPYGKELGYTPVIPLPPELSFFFKAIPERVVQYYKLQGTPEERDALRVARELMLSGVDIFWAPNLTPQLVKPFLENMMNYSFFLGRPLESQSQLRLDPSQRFGTSTSEAVKASAEALAQLGIELSPIKIENAIRGVLGMSAGVALSVADVMVNPTRTDRPLHQSLPAQLTGASAFMKDPVGTRFLDDMYDFEDKVAQAYNTYNRLVQTNPEKADAYLLENYGRYGVYQATKTVMESIRDLNKEAQIVDRAKDIPPDERRQIMNTLRAQQNELAQISYALRRQAQINQAEIDLR